MPGPRRSSRLPLGVISNGASDHQRQKMRSLGVMRWVSEEHVVISGDIGMPKPEPALYAEMERRLGVSGACLNGGLIRACSGAGRERACEGQQHHARDQQQGEEVLCKSHVFHLDTPF